MGAGQRRPCAESSVNKPESTRGSAALLGFGFLVFPRAEQDGLTPVLAAVAEPAFAQLGTAASAGHPPSC